MTIRSVIRPVIRDVIRPAIGGLQQETDPILEAAAVGGKTPDLYAAFDLNKYYVDKSPTTLDLFGNYSRASTATYVDSTGTLQTAAVNELRVGHHIWNGSEWVNEGVLIETEARTNLLLNSGTLTTQSVTVTEEAHTLSFTGTGTVTLSGTSTAGPLIGTGDGENNRVHLTFTPTAGTLTLTVSGTVKNAQLELGATPSSYIPTAGSTVTRAADTDGITIPAANMPYSATAMCFALEGKATYSDNSKDAEIKMWWWPLFGAVPYIRDSIRTNGTYTGGLRGVRFDRIIVNALSEPVPGTYAPGVNVPINVAVRHSANDINIAANGMSQTAVSAQPLPDLSAENLSLCAKWIGTIKRFRVWGGVGLTDAELEEATS